MMPAMNKALLLTSVLAATPALAPASAAAGPDPMASDGLEKVVVDVLAGDVQITIAKTAKVRLDGSARDAKRAGKTLTINRKAADVSLTVPEGVELQVDVRSGAITVSGPLARAKLNARSGDVVLTVDLAKDADVKAVSGSGDVNVTVQNDTKFRLKAISRSGTASGRKLSSKRAKAKLHVESASGDVSVRRAK